MRQHNKLLLLNDSRAKFQVAIQLSCLIRADHGLERSKEAGRVLHKGREYELIAALLKARSQIQGQGISLNDRVCFFDLSVKDAVKAD